MGLLGGLLGGYEGALDSGSHLKIKYGGILYALIWIWNFFTDVEQMY
jgi:hypothetical protein